MVLTPIILCNDGCCISSFVNIQVVKLLKMHKINFYQQNDMESYDKFKNPYYKVGMNTLDLLKLTFEKHNNIVMKLDYTNFQDIDIQNLLNKVKAKICCFLRWNILDILICRYKDFTNLSSNIIIRNKQFSKWRNSDDRKILKIPYKGNKIINDLKNIDKYYKNVRKNNKDIDFYYVEDFCGTSNGKTSIIEVIEKIFNTLGFVLNKDILNDYLNDCVIKEQYKHSDE